MAANTVIIVGGGIAGLTAARELARRDFSVTILEAQRRLGGRISSVRMEGLHWPAQLGAEFIHGRPEASWRIVRESGLTAYEVSFGHWMRRAGRLEQMPHFSSLLGRAMSGMSRVRGPDTSFAAYLRAHRAGREYAEARRVAVDFVEGFDAADPERISRRSLAQEREGLGDMEDQPQFRLVEGYGALVRHVIDSLEGEHVRIRMGVQVSEVRWNIARGVEVEFHVANGRGGQETLRASRVLVALPLGVLQRAPDAPDSVRFVPEIADHRRAMERLASGPIVKVLVVCKDRFWESPSVASAARASESLAKASFLHDPGAAVPVWWTQRPLQSTLLTGWAGGPRAHSLSGLSESEVVAAALDSLAGMFGKTLRWIERQVVGVRAHDWSRDRFAGGAYSYELVGAGAARAKLAVPLRQRLFFCGEATDTRGQASTVAGAIASGERAAREIIRGAGRG